MTARILFVVSTLFVCLAAGPPAAARHTKPDYSMEVLVDGRPLETLVSRGRTYIEAIPGQEYSIRLRNNTPRRVAIALSVDGLNTIDAKTTRAHEASKWILGPHQTITLDGWQTSQSTARRFFFTTEEESYGAWLGRTSNLGVVAAAVFREKTPQPSPISQHREKAETGKRRADAPARPGAAGEPGRQSASPGPAEMEADDLAATGIGRQVDHNVQLVPFDAEEAPAAVIEVRYEYHDALVRLGVLPNSLAPCDDPLSRREGARGFVDAGFAPDPYGERCP